VAFLVKTTNSNRFTKKKKNHKKGTSRGLKSI
jgi:hypothetical protein